MSRCQIQPAQAGKMSVGANDFSPAHFHERVFCFFNLMVKRQGFMKALRCRECGREYPLEARHVCEFDFGPLEVVYDYSRAKKSLTRKAVESRPKSIGTHLRCGGSWS